MQTDTAKESSKMIKIDGSEGEGGGQVIRSSLALSMITGKPFEIDNIRARRSKPGLARQHLTCVRAAAAICDASVEGDELKSTRLSFAPGAIKPGDYQFSIGTAGSTSLVAQTILPALLIGSEPSTLVIEGGTHNSMAPPFDFLAESYLKIVNRMGPQVDTSLQGYGFYPAGGGKVTFAITPSIDWTGLNLVERGKTIPFVTAIVSALPRTIGQRECDAILRKSNWPRKNSHAVIEVEHPQGPGNIVMIRMASDSVSEVFSGVGEVGVKAEHVARKVLRAARAYLAAEVPVGPHLADQLMLPCAIAATHGQCSTYRTMPLSQHSKTHIDVIQRFLDINIRVDANLSDAKDAKNETIEIQFEPEP